MTDPRLWAIVGAVIGSLLGSVLQHQRSLGWLWGCVAGAVGFTLGALICRQFSTALGKPAGWAIGGPVGFTIAGAILMMAVGNPQYPIQCAVVGTIGGSIAGAVLGPLCGAVALWEETGPLKRSSRFWPASAWSIAAVFFLGIAAIAWVILKSE